MDGIKLRWYQEGTVIFGEPIAASLSMNGSHYYHTCWRHAAAYVLSPPLRHAHNSTGAIFFLFLLVQYYGFLMRKVHFMRNGFACVHREDPTTPDYLMQVTLKSQIHVCDIYQV